jgi:hypothetical protein
LIVKYFFQLLLLLIVCHVQPKHGTNRPWWSVGVLPAKLSNTFTGIGFLTETNPDTIAVDIDGWNVLCQNELHDLIFLAELHIDLITSTVLEPRDDMKISLVYWNTGLLMLYTQRLGSAEVCAKLRESRKALLLLCHNYRDCLNA